MLCFIWSIFSYSISRPSHLWPILTHHMFNLSWVTLYFLFHVLLNQKHLRVSIQKIWNYEKGSGGFNWSSKYFIWFSINIIIIIYWISWYYLCNRFPCKYWAGDFQSSILLLGVEGNFLFDLLCVLCIFLNPAVEALFSLYSQNVCPCAFERWASIYIGISANVFNYYCNLHRGEQMQPPLFPKGLKRKKPWSLWKVCTVCCWLCKHSA